MKTRFFSYLIFALFLSVFYVMVETGVGAQEPLPPPAPDYFPDRWDECTSQQGRFRIRFPGKPKESTTTEDTPAGKLVTLDLQYKGLLQYSVTFMDYEKLLSGQPTEQQLLEGSKNAVLDKMKANNMRLMKERAVTIDGHAGYFLHAEYGASGVVRVEWVIAGKRVYILVVDGRKGSPNELEGKDDFEKVAVGFINSFHVMP
ncbi:MAG TPA: hypothetical protein VJT09_18630 [Pyrinomonadaceae bacterium]|nr:hypothetical protein [Pyrinomonadaceae bacterium]